MSDLAAAVTVVTAPRDRYGKELDTIEHLLTGGEPLAEVIVVHEARCPARVERTVLRLERAGHLRHRHLARRAGANACRSAGLALVETPYVLLLDNDARVEVGAVRAMVERAEATGASFVSPVCLNSDGTLHYAGSVVRFTGIDGRRHLFEVRMHGYGPAGDVRPWLQPVPTDAPELHGVLVHVESLRAAGGLDDTLSSTMDCLDLGLRLLPVRAGGWLEPRAAVVYAPAAPRPRDWPLYFDRWCGATVEHDIAHFTTSWGIDPGSEPLADHRGSMVRRRWLPIRRVRGAVRRTMGNAAAARFQRRSEGLLDRFSMVGRGDGC